MIFWLIAILVLILTGAALILPLLRRAPAVPEATRGLAIYRDQLAEIGAQSTIATCAVGLDAYGC